MFDTVQSVLEATIQGAGLRAKALQSNLANANTPGYRRVDVDFHGELKRALAAKSAGGSFSPQFSSQTDQAGAVRPDGSNVDIDAEGAMLAENAMEYQAAAQLLAVRKHMYETAMRTQG
jgi:flagellar basal-body rod protein FlgB